MHFFSLALKSPYSSRWKNRESHTYCIVAQHVHLDLAKMISIYHKWELHRRTKKQHKCINHHFILFVQGFLQCNKVFAKQKARLKLMMWFKSQYLLMMFVKEHDHYTSLVKPSPFPIFITRLYASVNQTGPIIKNKQNYQLTEITASDIPSNETCQQIWLRCGVIVMTNCNQLDKEFRV